MQNSITYVAMDTHKKEHKVALNYPGSEEVFEFTVKNSSPEIKRMVKKILKRAPGDVQFCYEAGVCGFTLKRRIEMPGCKCAVIAPSLTPIRPGDRIKTDRRDAKKLLAMFKAGLLTEVYTPHKKQESARELTRCRQTAQENLKRIRHQLLKFLNRYGYAYTNGNHWTNKHINWLRTLEFDQPFLPDVFDSYFTEMQHCLQRLAFLDKEVERLSENEPYKKVVGFLRCFHGIDTLTAVTIVGNRYCRPGRTTTPKTLLVSC